MDNICSLPRIGPYVGVQKDQVVTFEENGRSFRLLLYGAYNAMGLIGSECNGIAVLDEDRMLVVADEIGRDGTGYFGASPGQVELWEEMVAMDWEQFQEAVNGSKRLRGRI